MSCGDESKQGKQNGATNSEHVCFLVRHGQRLDELRGWRNSEWFQDRFNLERRYPLDPPLTETGSKQAQSAANIFLENVENHQLTCIFTSPLHRTLKTALEFAKILNLPLIIVPGLASCTAACRSGPIRKDPEGNLSLPSRGNIFLTKQEMRDLCEGVELTFHDSNLNFNETLDLLIQENTNCICVTHREGIRPFLTNRTRIGYCHIQELHLGFENNKWWGIQSQRTVFEGYEKNKKYTYL